MRAFKNGGDLACVCCFEACCFGCEIAARFHDTDDKEDGEGDHKDSDGWDEP